MPHTNRKKKSSDGTKSKPRTQVHSKRQQLDDDEGWTHIVDTKPSKTPTVDEISLQKPQKPWEGDFVVGGNAIVNITLEEIQGEHTRFTQQWEDSDACTQLKNILADLKGKNEIKNIICLGLGSLQDWKLQARRASHTQFAALEMIVKELDIGTLPRFAQEPRFTELDKKFMTNLGYEVLEDPQAFEKIEKESFVFAVHCYSPLYQKISLKGQPVLLVANDLEAYSQQLKIQQSDDPELAQDLERLAKDCSAIPFPEIRHDFSDTKIYHRQAEEKH